MSHLNYNICTGNLSLALDFAIFFSLSLAHCGSISSLRVLVGSAVGAMLFSVPLLMNRFTKSLFI